MKGVAGWISRIVLAFLLALALLGAGIYFFSTEFKAVLLEKICRELSGKIGHKVFIRDFDVNFSAITLHHIIIRNREGCRPGNLLAVQSVQIEPAWDGLLHGEIHLKKVYLSSPQLTLVKEKGKWNLSDDLLKLLTEKPKKKAKYLVDDFRIFSGQLEFARKIPFRADMPYLHIRNLSSERSARTDLQAVLLQSNGNRLWLHGWSFLQSEKKQTQVALNCQIKSLEPFGTSLIIYGLNVQKTVLGAALSLQGDMDKGFDLNMSLSARKLLLPYFKLEPGELSGKVSALLNLKQSSLIIDKLSFRADNFLDAEARGNILYADWKRNFAYDIEARVRKMDLSYFAFPRIMKAEGLLSSPALFLKGNAAHLLLSASGSFSIKGGAIKAESFEARNIASQVVLPASKESSVKADISGDILRAGKYAFREPLHAATSGSLKFISGKELKIEGALASSSFAMDLEDGRKLSVGPGKMHIAGTALLQPSFQGAAAAEFDEASFSGFNIKKPRLILNFLYKNGEIHLENSGLTSDMAVINWKKMRIVLREKNKLAVTGNGISCLYRPGDIRINNSDFSLHLASASSNKLLSAQIELTADKIEYAGLAGSFSGQAFLNDDLFQTNFSLNGIAGGKLNCAASGKALLSEPFPLQLSIQAENLDIKSLWEKLPAAKKLQISGLIKAVEFNGSAPLRNQINGTANLALADISVKDLGSGRSLIKSGILDGRLEIKDSNAKFDSAFGAGPFTMKVSGAAKNILEKERTVSAHGVIPDIKLTDIRTVFWDLVPDSLLYLGLDGSVSSQWQLNYDGVILGLNGALALNNVTIQGENGEYAIGPILGKIPLEYASDHKEYSIPQLPAFEATNFKELAGYYSRPPAGSYNNIDGGSVRYGFKILDNVKFSIKAEKNILDLALISADIFNGTLKGSGIIDISKGLNYSGGFILQDLSLANLTDSIEPIRGYLSGKIDGVGYIKGSGGSLPQIKGRADFWAHPGQDEKMKISKEFLQKVGGPSLKSYIGDRNFDRGIMSIYVSEGDIIFKELEISNRNFFGITDLSIKVAPFNNRISLDHLMWSVTEAARRAKEKQVQQ